MYSFVYTTIGVVLTCICAVTLASSDERPKVGIVGAGIGGSSAAYFLRELFGDDVDIDVYEKERIGGRLAPVSISGQTYNAGGTIIHPDNLYMKNFTDILGLSRDHNAGGGQMGIYNGEEVVFSTSAYQLVTLTKLFWRYGMDIYNIRSWIRENTLNYFFRLYDLQRDGHAFSTVEDLINAMDPSLLSMTKKSTSTLFKEGGFSDTFIDEFVSAAMRINYGQEADDVHGFTGAVSMAGIEQGLWNVVGGNHKVPEGLLKKSGANVIRGEVTTVSLSSEGSPPLYQIDYLPGGSKSEDDIKSKEYDIIILATPIYKGMTKIKFEDFQSEIRPVNNDFHLTVAAFMEGLPNTSYFGYRDSDEFPTAFLTNNKDLFFNAFVKMKPCSLEETESPVYRTFSRQVPSIDQLKQLVPEWSDLRVVNWMAYPKYQSSVELPSFTLHEQMYHVNAIEMAASAMEMSVIGAKNVALLAYYRYTGQYDKIDEVLTSSDSTKTEL